MEKDSQTDSKHKLHFKVFFFPLPSTKVKQPWTSSQKNRANMLVGISMVYWLTGSGWSLWLSLTPKQKIWHCPKWWRILLFFQHQVTSLLLMPSELLGNKWMCLSKQFFLISLKHSETLMQFIPSSSFRQFKNHSNQWFIVWWLWFLAFFIYF